MRCCGTGTRELRSPALAMRAGPPPPQPPQPSARLPRARPGGPRMARAARSRSPRSTRVGRGGSHGCSGRRLRDRVAHHVMTSSTASDNARRPARVSNMSALASERTCLGWWNARSWPRRPRGFPGFAGADPFPSLAAGATDAARAASLREATTRCPRRQVPRIVRLPCTARADSSRDAVGERV